MFGIHYTVKYFYYQVTTQRLFFSQRLFPLSKQMICTASDYYTFTNQLLKSKLNKLFININSNINKHILMYGNSLLDRDL